MTTFRKQRNNYWRYRMSCECSTECVCEEECDCEFDTCECSKCLTDMVVDLYDNGCPCGGNCQCGNASSPEYDF